MADRYVLDTSAIFALTDQEEGGDEVEALLDRAGRGDCQIAISAASLMEIYYITLQESGEDQAAQLVGLVKSWPVTWIYPEEKTFLLAGRIKASNRLSFADALIAALAKLQGATLVHKDPELTVLGRDVAMRALPFKGSRSAT